MTVERDELFKVSKLKHQDSIITAELEINRDSAIFKGHFPGHPVVPGACMLQLVKDVLAGVLNSSIRLKKADQLKFIVLIDPTNTRTLRLHVTYKIIDEDLVNTIAKLIAGEVTCFKFHGTFLRG